MDFSEKMLGKSFSCFTIHCPLPTDIAVFMLCWEQWCNVPAHEGLCTETGLASEQSLYKSILPLKIFAKQSYSLISNYMFWIDFVLSLVSVGYFLPLDEVSSSCQVISYDGFQHFPMKWAFLPKVPAQSTALLLFKVSRHIKPPKSFLVQCQVTQPSPSPVLRSVSVPNASFPWAETLLCAKRHPWGLCSPPWTSEEREGAWTASGLTFHKVPTDF